MTITTITAVVAKRRRGGPNYYVGKDSKSRPVQGARRESSELKINLK
jgi:hypothetical protein